MLMFFMYMYMYKRQVCLSLWPAVLNAISEETDVASTDT